MGRYAFFGDLTQLRRALEITLPPPARPGRGAMLPQGIDHGRRHREVADFRDNHGVPAPISLEWRRMPSAVVTFGVAIGLTNPIRHPTGAHMPSTSCRPRRAMRILHRNGQRVGCSQESTGGVDEFRKAKAGRRARLCAVGGGGATAWKA